MGWENELWVIYARLLRPPQIVLVMHVLQAYVASGTSPKSPTGTAEHIPASGGENESALETDWPRESCVHESSRCDLLGQDSLTRKQYPLNVPRLRLGYGYIVMSLEQKWVYLEYGLGSSSVARPLLA